MTKLLALLLFILTGCYSDVRDDPNLPPVKPPPVKPAACPYAQAQLPSPCLTVGQVCEFITNERHVWCSCQADGTQSCRAV
jgi:hypothetical protein